MNTQTTQTEDHGKQQAKAQAEGVAAMVAALACDYDRLQELRDEREALADEIDGANTASAYGLEQEATARAALAAWDEENAEELKDLENEAGDCADQDEARARIQEDPLSVEVRSGWDVVGGDLGAAEFRIVLCTGGPHVEIRGELDQYGTPCRAWMQYQDWGTPLTQYFDVSQSTLLAYCQEFYFEG
jgi:hypothetical protein